MPATSSDTAVRIPVEGRTIEASLTVPDRPAGVVIFAHGRGGVRGDGRSGLVAAELQKAGLATLDYDLLTPAELAEPDYKFSAAAPARRLQAIIGWAGEHKDLGSLPLALLGWGTGTSAALVAASQPGNPVRAVVSCGGRPEFAGDAARGVTAPVLFVVGGFDWAIIDLNEAAVNRMLSAARMEVVAKATNEFEEEGTLEAASRLARDWFGKWLGTRQEG
ncbi:MAG: alpha/beta hydrolase [Planctomycetota bacterium]